MLRFLKNRSIFPRTAAYTYPFFLEKNAPFNILLAPCFMQLFYFLLLTKPTKIVSSFFCIFFLRILQNCCCSWNLFFKFKLFFKRTVAVVVLPQHFYFTIVLQNTLKSLSICSCSSSSPKPLKLRYNFPF